MSKYLQAKQFLREMIEERFKDKIVLSSSFGTYSALLIKMVTEIKADIAILFLDTGKHFQQTLEYVKYVQQFCQAENIIHLRPDQKLLDKYDIEGNLWQSNPDLCCSLRKVVPLNRYLDENKIEAIITGRRKYQTTERQQLEYIEQQADNRYKINPFTDCTQEDIEAMFRESAIKQHPLFADGYLSIGCQPCTSIVKEGEDSRSGRWSHKKDKKECGLHI